MTVLGIDVSHHNSADMVKLRIAGIGFVICKATEGTGFTDPAYAGRASAARSASMPFAAYHFLRADTPGRAQAIHAMSVVGHNSIPIILDIETDSSNGHPSMVQAMEFTSQIRLMGGRVSLWYLPFWYWHGFWRSAPLPGNAPPLWQSIYPAGNAPGDNEFLYHRVGADQGVGWQAMAGHPVFLWQYGSNGRVPGASFPVDVNAYRGTPLQLAASGIVTSWGHGAPVPSPTEPTKELAGMEMVEAQKGVVLIVGDQRYGLNPDIVTELRRQGVPFRSFKDSGVPGLVELGTRILEGTPTG